MVKFNAKNLAMVVFLGMLLFGLIGVVNAQQVLPKGGDSFETAIKLEPGDYEGGAMKNGESEYFYINVKPGQEIKIEGVIKPDGAGEGGLTLYDEDRKELVEEGAIVEEKPEQFTISWLLNSDKDSYKYYLKRYCNWVKIGSLSFDISLINHYDAGSQTDAGDTVEKAIEIASGEYKSYLSGEAGADTKDFYKVAAKKGETLTVKVTPPSEATMRIAVYDKDRKVLKDEYASNPGAIVTNSVSIAKSEDIFVAVICDRYCSENFVAYTLDITSQAGAKLPGEETVLPEGTTGWPTGEGPTGEELAKTGIRALIITLLIPMIIGLIVLVAIIVVIVILIRKKR